ncbi:MAG TPA: glycosyltransferase family A protein [Edaphobacter sp.]
MSLSVIIPAYNAARYLADTLNSVMRQTVLPDEILVIDDGSTDETAAIAESFGPLVRVYRRTNSKLSATRNFGVQQATGEWIALLDADDLWEPNKLERQLAVLAANPTADVCYTGRIEMLDDGKTLTPGKVISVADPRDIRKALFRNTNFLPSAVIVRRSLYLSTGGCDPKVVIEDWDLWLRLLHAGAKFVCCPEPLVHYRIHTASLTAKTGMIAFQSKEEIYNRLVYPYLPRSTRWFTRNKIRSEHEYCAAYVLRAGGDLSQAFHMMLRSVLRAPFYYPYRYKVLAHMLYTRFLHRNSPAESRQSLAG